MSGTHDPDAIERIAEAMYTHLKGHSVGEWRISRDEPLPAADDYTAQDYYLVPGITMRRMAAAALRSIDALYDEGGDAA